MNGLSFAWSTYCLMLRQIVGGLHTLALSAYMIDDDIYAILN